MINDFWAKRLIAFYRWKLVFFPYLYCLDQKKRIGMVIGLAIVSLIVAFAIVTGIVHIIEYLGLAPLGVLFSIFYFWIFSFILFMIFNQMWQWKSLRGHGKKVDVINMEFRIKCIQKFLSKCEIRDFKEFRQTLSKVNERNFVNFFRDSIFEVKFSRFLLLAIFSLAISFVLSVASESGQGSVLVLGIIAKVFEIAMMFFFLSFCLMLFGKRFPLSSQQLKMELDDILSEMEFRTELNSHSFTKCYLGYDSTAVFIYDFEEKSEMTVLKEFTENKEKLWN